MNNNNTSLRQKYLICPSQEERDIYEHYRIHQPSANPPSHEASINTNSASFQRNGESLSSLKYHTSPNITSIPYVDSAIDLTYMPSPNALPPQPHPAHPSANDLYELPARTTTLSSPHALSPNAPPTPTPSPPPSPNTHTHTPNPNFPSSSHIETTLQSLKQHIQLTQQDLLTTHAHLSAICGTISTLILHIESSNNNTFDKEPQGFGKSDKANNNKTSSSSSSAPLPSKDPSLTPSNTPLFLHAFLPAPAPCDPPSLPDKDEDDKNDNVAAVRRCIRGRPYGKMLHVKRDRYYAQGLCDKHGGAGDFEVSLRVYKGMVEGKGGGDKGVWEWVWRCA